MASSGTTTPRLVGCVAATNGQSSSFSNADRCNFYVGSGVQNWKLVGCSSIGGPTTQYGFYINNTTYSGTFEGCDDTGTCVISGIFTASSSNIIWHNNLSSTITHPPLSLTGSLTMNANAVDTVGRFGFNAWQTISSITSGTISVTTSSLFTLNLAAPDTVTDITYNAAIGIPYIIFRNSSSNAVTFQYNASKLRTNSGANVVLGQYQSISFVWISGVTWQQV